MAFLILFHCDFIKRKIYEWGDSVVHLLRKDFRLLRSPQYFLIAIVLGLLMSFTSQSMTYMGPFIALFLIVSVDWAEADEKRDVFINSLPVKRKDVVQTKYVEGLVLAVLVNVVTPLLEVPFNMVTNSTSTSFTFITFCVGISITLLILAFYYPFLIAFGRIVTFVALIATAMFLNPFLYYMDQIPNTRILVIVLLIFAMAYGYSYFPALQIYRKKDF